jgi:hypothetical protein
MRDRDNRKLVVAGENLRHRQRLYAGNASSRVAYPAGNYFRYSAEQSQFDGFQYVAANVMTIADEVDAQLTQSMGSYMKQAEIVGCVVPEPPNMRTGLMHLIHFVLAMLIIVFISPRSERC